MKPFICLFITVTAAAQGLAADFNHAEALQKSIFFFEGQKSDWLSPNNRVEWRAPAHTDDGRDAGLDLSGGWYDTGDHWKTNTTMASTITKISWSVLLYPEVFAQTGQMDEFLENLKYGTDYFLKCIVDENPDDPENSNNFVICELRGDYSNKDLKRYTLPLSAKRSRAHSTF